MDADTRMKYWQGITQIEAQNALLSMSISDYPYAKKEERKKMHKQMHQTAYPVDHENPTGPITSMEDFAKIMGNMLNG